MNKVTRGVDIFEAICLPKFGRKIVDIIQDENLVVLLFSAAVTAASSGRRNIIFNPIPPQFIGNIHDIELAMRIEKEYVELLGDTSCRRSMDKFDALVNEEMKRYDLLDELLKKLNDYGGVAKFVGEVRKIYEENVFKEESVGDDNMLHAAFISANLKNVDIFNFMRFSLMNNKLTFQKNDIIIGDPSKVKHPGGTNEALQVKAEHVHKFYQYEVIHTRETELEFETKKKDVGNCYLFHGTGKQNVYSLACNGIKVASGTKLMTTGAVYGNGVYASDTLTISYNYSGGFYSYGSPQQVSNVAPLHTNSDDILTENSVVAIYEIIGSKETYKKAEGYFVIPDDSLLLIRSLIAIPSAAAHSVVNATTSQNLLEAMKTRGNVLQKNLRSAMIGWRRRIRGDLKTAISNGMIVYMPPSSDALALVEYNPKKHNAGKILKAGNNAIAPHLVRFHVAFKSHTDTKKIEISFPLDYAACPPVVYMDSVVIDPGDIVWNLRSEISQYVRCLTHQTAA